MNTQPKPSEIDFRLLRAYALGYYWGRTRGEREEVPEGDDLCRLYDEGYQAGVSDYWYDAHGHEE